MAVELRVHGVGGSPGAALLGLRRPEEVVVVGEGIGTAFLARRQQREVEGYDWGALTSGSILQPLWLLLLPFTLVNVAGWMHPPFAAVDERRIRSIRAVVHLLAGSLTANYTLWIALMTVDLIGYRWLPRGLGLVLGGAGAAAVMWGLGRIARNTVQEFEERRPAEPAHDAPKAWTWDETLRSASFFDHAPTVSHLRDRHMAVQWLTLIIAGALTLRALIADAPTTGIGWAIVVLFMAQAVLLLALLILTTPAQGEPPARRTRWRAAMAVILAVAFTNGFFAGGALLLLRILGLPSAPTPELGLVDAYFVLVVVWLVAAAAFVLWHRARATSDDLPPRSTGPGDELDGVDDAWRKKIRHARGHAAAGRRADQLLAFMALSGLAVATYLGLHRLLGNPPCEPWNWSGGGGGLQPCYAGLLNYSGVLLTGFLLLILGYVRQAVTTKKLRRTVGIAWDVLTFWPRRFHPYAVRPYAERAVPEFQSRIRGHVDRGERVLVSAHSQGTVIAFAALAPLCACRLGAVALVTHGCPITTLYAPNFPAYFGPDDVAALRAQLLGDRPGGWLNLHRRTDPIGGPVFSPSDDCDPSGGNGDICLEDPATIPRATAIPTDPAGIEDDRRAWTEVAGHSGYYLERRTKEITGHSKTLLATAEVSTPCDHHDLTAV